VGESRPEQPTSLGQRTRSRLFGHQLIGTGEIMASIELCKPGRKLRLLLLEENGDGEDPTVWEMDYDGNNLPGDPRHTPAKLHDWLAAKKISPCEARRQAEKELTRKVEELTRSNRELEQFAVVATHDLREPLRMMATYTQLLAERYRDKLDHHADQYIEYVTDGALRMQALIEGLLALSCVGRQNAEPHDIDCNLLVEEVMRDLNVMIRKTNAVVHNEPLPPVLAHRPYLLQVFHNLIENAIRYRGKEAPVVSLLAEPVGQEWLFSVTDNGIGIAAEQFENIFTAFHRLNPRGEYPGNGLGLAISKKVVEHYGGRIWVESQLGCGSSFKFTLPACEPGAPEA
jgi:two-component system, chemotaxis family, sensor kinase Cph1